MKELPKDSKSFEGLSHAAWMTRGHASVPVTGTMVGCALSSGINRTIIGGCNVEHPFLSTTIHAEANAIGSMISMLGPDAKFQVILIAAVCHKFTPCGMCMDMIMHYGGPLAIVGYQNDPDRPIHYARARELMPEYPY